MKVLNDLLDKYKVDRDFQMEIREEYREEVQSILQNAFSGQSKTFRYGGSLAKGTANTNSCDIDLLCYLHSDTNLTLKEIYNTAKKALEKDYNIEVKNSAITIKGKKYKSNWGITVDVVPGRFINTDKSDVNLWCNRTQTSLKTNPDKQINLVKESNSKEIIRLIKLFREFNNFKFKSFFLEIFAIDIVEKKYEKQDDVMAKLLKFCDCYNEIGITTINDPANSNNNIMEIHDELEFKTIRSKIKQLREALYTDDEETVKNCILGKYYDIDTAYKRVARKHSRLIKFKERYTYIIKGWYSKNESNYKNIDTTTILEKGMNLKFEITIPNSIPIKKVSWIICNSGYEARIKNQLRGDTLEDSNDIDKISMPNNKIFIKTENTAYYGDHYVQAEITSQSGSRYYSNIITVRIRN